MVQRYWRTKRDVKSAARFFVVGAKLQPQTLAEESRVQYQGKGSTVRLELFQGLVKRVLRICRGKKKRPSA